MHNDAFRQIVGTKAKNIYYIAPQGHKTYCRNTNELLESYPGCTGIKTGWTSAARGCLSAAAKRGDKELIAVDALQRSRRSARLRLRAGRRGRKSSS